MKMTKVNCLHVNINVTHKDAELNWLLFELLVLGTVRSIATSLHHHVAHDMVVYVEVANSSGGKLFNKLHALGVLPVHHVAALPPLSVRAGVVQCMAQYQLVCAYLGLLGQKHNHHAGYSFPCPASLRGPAMLGNHLGEVLSFSTLNVFILTLAAQLREFTSSSFFKVYL